MADLVVSLPSAQIPSGASLVCQAWIASDDPLVTCEADVGTEILDLAILAASDLVYLWSGQRYPGVCTEAGLRPCAHPGAGDGRSLARYTGGDGWWGLGGARAGGCNCNSTERGNCAPVPEIAPFDDPLVAVTQVKVDGAVLDPAKYRIDDGRWLVRIDGDNWYCCQNLIAADTEVGTWSFDCSHGAAPPAAGRLAVAVLACQLAKALAAGSGGQCRLPTRTTTVTRQGVTAVVLDPFSFLDKGRTGLIEVDYFVNSVNRAGIIRAATAGRPEWGPKIRRTG